MTETDHKLLLAVLKTKQLDELTLRIQCFCMHLMRFSYEITHTAGKKPYDSRHHCQGFLGAVQLKKICSRYVCSFHN